MRGFWFCTALALTTVFVSSAWALTTLYIGRDALLEENPRANYSRFVNVRPGDGETVHLNPPRFSWFYVPEAEKKLPAGKALSGNHIFTFQISATPDFSESLVNITTPYNFYNTLPVLEGSQRWFWRVGYDVGLADEWWSQTYSFHMASNAVRWNRSALASPPLESMGHPRILLNRQNLEAVRQLRETNPFSRAIFQRLQQEASRIITLDWWHHFPKTDRQLSPEIDHQLAPEPFVKIAHDLAVVAFVWLITKDEKYAGVIDRAVTLASYPRGGRASPQGAGGESSNSTQTNEFLALLFDWLYQQLSEEQRQTMIESLEWRVDYWMDEFAWKRKGKVHEYSLAMQCGSHQYEGSMDTAVAGLALYEHSPIGRVWFDLITNYLLGVTNGFGFDEGWNEGAGYGNSKMRWLMHATLYFDTTLNMNLGKNPFYRNIGDFFARLTPVGLSYSPWGNNSVAQPPAYERYRIATFRKLAFLTGEGRFLRNWHETGGGIARLTRLWIEYVLPHYYRQPEESLEAEMVKLFPIAGWGIAATQPPSSRKAFKRGVGVIFQSRPRGGYGHSFNSDGSFQIYAYGKQVNSGGGSTKNNDAFSYHTMSHTTILIDGLGQAQPGRGQLLPRYAEMVAFKYGEDFAYFAADITNTYPRQPGDYQRWGFPLDPIYQKRAADHLRRLIRHVLLIKGKYVVVFDDIEAGRPATFTWLYHILPEQPFKFDARMFKVDYAVDDVNVQLMHIAHTDNLALDDRRGLDSVTNPFTGEDYRDYVKGTFMPAHNLWVSNRRPQRQLQFLAVIFPYHISESAPVIQKVDDATVRVIYGRSSDLITFSPEKHPRADFVVDASGIKNSRSQ